MKPYVDGVKLKNRKEEHHQMYTENDFMTPRDRINDALLRRVSSEAPSCRLQNGETQRQINNKPLENGSGRMTWGLEEYPLASVYAPLQAWRNLYDNETGFSRGTIFKELDLPFLCGDRTGGNCYGR